MSDGGFTDHAAKLPITDFDLARAAVAYSDTKVANTSTKPGGQCGGMLFSGRRMRTSGARAGYNLSRTWPGDGSRSDDYVATLGFNLSDRWSSFMEVYGTMTGVVTSNYDGGFAFLVNDNLGLDLSVGYDGDYGDKSYFLDFGVSFRVDDHAQD